MANNNLPLLILVGGAALVAFSFMGDADADKDPIREPGPISPGPISPGPTPPQPLVNISVAERPIRMSVRPL